MIKTDVNKTNNQQRLKPYSSVRLIVYGQMVKLTASGSGASTESGTSGNCNQAPGKAKC